MLPPSIRNRAISRSARSETSAAGRFGGYGYGFGHGGIGIIGFILIVVVVLMLLGRI
jgi:hypothetical protein